MLSISYPSNSVRLYVLSFSKKPGAMFQPRRCAVPLPVRELDRGNHEPRGFGQGENSDIAVGGLRYCDGITRPFQRFGSPVPLL